MNITRENFEDNFDTLRKAIRASHFVAVDTEFTGLRAPGMAKERSTDSVKARYHLARASCSTFMVTQYGLCCFRFDDDGRLEARPFNAFITPSTYFGMDRVYSCQASSVEFLSNHGFDFQAWGAHGVPFLSRSEEATIKEKITARWAREAAAAALKQEAHAAEVKEGAHAAAMEVASISTEDLAPAQPPVEAARDGTTLESLEEAERNMILDARQQVEALLIEMSREGDYVEKSLKLDPMNRRQRWLIYEFVGANNPAVKLSNLNGPHFARGIEIRTVSKDPEVEALAEAKIREDAEARQMEDLRKAVGFRRVIDELSESGKPVITHNGLLDLFHTYDKFVGPIPADFEEGTRAMHAFLPRVLDSKVVMKKGIAEGLALPCTTLGDAFRWLRENYSAATARRSTALGVETDGAVEENGECKGNDKAHVEDENERRLQAWDAVFAPGFEERYTKKAQEHEAGYDAYLTGCCFVAAATLGLSVGVEEVKGMSSGGVIPKALVPVWNSIPLYRVLGGQRMCLPGPTPPPDFSRYLHVSGFPSAAKTDAVMRPLKAVSGCDWTWFHWIDDTSGVAEFPTAEAVQALLRAAASASAATSDLATKGQSDAVDTTQLLLGDMKIVQLEPSILEIEEDDGLEKRSTKRFRQEGAQA